MGQADDILRSVKKVEAKEGQGKLKIFMGMVAGVGKTYAMLKAAHALKQSHENPVIGYVETHGRKETEELLSGLDSIPRKKLPYKDVTLEEFDIDACLARKPKLVLIDELAHTNVPGSRHDKRWQDVLEILNNGIDVYTTLNVQHIESRSEMIASFTGVRVQELVPDSLIDRADEIVLIDLIPDEIVTRLKTGKIYAPDKVDSATQNFFKISNLTALRQISLRLMAERVDHELKDLSSIQGITSSKTRLKIMVTIFGSPYSESLIRYTRKMAYGLNCPWFAAYVNTDNGMSEEERELLYRNIELVKLLGGEVVSTQNESVADGILSLAQQNGASQIIVGKSQRDDLISKIFSYNSLPYQLIDKSKGIDINVISPEERIAITKTGKSKSAKKDFELDWRGALTTLGYLANLTFINAILLPIVHYRAIGIIYLTGITVGSLFIKSYNVFLAAILGGICWNIFFIPPRFTFSIKETEDWMLLFLYVVAGLVIGEFTRRLKIKEETLRNEGNRATQLYNITKELSVAEDLETLTKTVINQIELLFDCPSTIFIKGIHEEEYDPSPQDGVGAFIIPSKEEYALQWVVKNRLSAGRFTDTLPSSVGHYIPLLADKKVIGIIAIDVSKLNILSHDQKLVLDAMARQMATGIRREILEDELRGKLVSEESERIYKTLLNSVSHEIRTPLAAIKGFASVILRPDVSRDPLQVENLAKEVSFGADRLDIVVQNLLDMSRLESGNLKLNLDYIDLKELVNNAIRKVKRTHGEKEVRLMLDENLPLLYLDHILVEQSVENILRNAFIYTPPDTPIDITTIVKENSVVIIIQDYGPGIEGGDPSVVFKKFYRENPKEAGGLGLGLSICKAIIELHRGQIKVGNTLGKGAAFELELPRELDREILKHE